MPPAPEFAATVRWPWQPAPLQLGAMLRGQVAAILFWRLGCVHSRAALADLALLQATFAGRPFAAVALHVPVAKPEREAARFQAAVARHAPALAHGIDDTGQAFSVFGAEGYPTLVLVDAAGQVRFSGRGEPKIERLRAAIDALLLEGQAAGLLAATPFQATAMTAPPPSALRSPAALCERDGELWLADAGNRRLLVFDPDTGVVRLVIGSGKAGIADGPAATATFCWPAALLAVGSQVLVADADAHLLRTVDPGGDVVTVCGTGVRGSDRYGGGFGSMQALAMPNALLRGDAGVVVAMAGTHQLWQFDLETQSASAWLGTGEQLLRDGGEAATFAQPAGLASDGHTLWVADAGNGALRAVDLAHAWVRTRATSLQRPVAVALHGGALLVADAWAGQVLRFDAAGGDGTVVAGKAEGLVEPSALLVRGERLWIVDAGDGRIATLDLAAALPAATLRPFELQGLPAA